jgi:hypothetical protein
MKAKSTQAKKMRSGVKTTVSFMAALQAFQLNDTPPAKPSNISAGNLAENDELMRFCEKAHELTN